MASGLKRSNCSVVQEISAWILDPWDQCFSICVHVSRSRGFAAYVYGYSLRNFPSLLYDIIIYNTIHPLKLYYALEKKKKKNTRTLYKGDVCTMVTTSGVHIVIIQCSADYHYNALLVGGYTYSWRINKTLYTYPLVYHRVIAMWTTIFGLVFVSCRVQISVGTHVLGTRAIIRLISY